MPKTKSIQHIENVDIYDVVGGVSSPLCIWRHDYS